MGEARTVQYREVMIDCMERTLAAFVRLIKGEAFTKHVVKLSA